MPARRRRGTRHPEYTGSSFSVPINRDDELHIIPLPIQKCLPHSSAEVSPLFSAPELKTG